MPELPEVETVRGGLEKILKNDPVITEVILNRPDIRFAIPKDLPLTLRGQTVTGVRRRAKYILIDTQKGSLLNHLGMTGSWRILKPGEEDVHDHCYILLGSGQRLAFRDPRRFGMLDLVRPGEAPTHPRLKSLGVEPLDVEAFTGGLLFLLSRRRKIAVKAFIMDQRIVVGVGNIYASEALYRAQLRPSRPAGRVTRAEYLRLADACRSVLLESIAAGGSSISDYRQASGESGSFQNAHQVYDREDKPCRVCGTNIKARVIGGRSTFWCPTCQS
jgi:formamidopyrimidine-DNA glycosylase